MPPSVNPVHPPPWTGQPYSVKRHGADITNCDSEPVQTPGCIQANGVLLVLHSDTLAILQASENAERWLGYPAEGLLGQHVSAALGQQGATRVKDFLTTECSELNPLYLFSLAAKGNEVPLDVTVHRHDGVVIVECEAIFGGAKQPRDDYSMVLKRTVVRLQTAQTLRDFCRVACEEIRSLTGLDRVMVYRFHEDQHGEVFAESKKEHLSPWFGLHYPSEDIPLPAREIFKRIWIRPVPDVGAELAEVIPLVNPQTGRPLDMTYCSLRGPSVMYTEYLQNMGVTAALTMPIRFEGNLWGLIACHQYSGPSYLSPHLRAACELFAQIVSLQYHSVEQREQLAYRIEMDGVHQQLLANAVRDESIEAIVCGKPTLYDAMNAGGAALYYGQRWWRLGETPSEAQLDGLRDWLSGRFDPVSSVRPLYATDALSRDYPPAEAFKSVASGVLAMPLADSIDKTLVLWFRPETIQTVSWGGNPYDKPMKSGIHGPRLTPRRSFELFVESVRLRSLPWKTCEIDAACRLRLLLLDVVIGRAERLGSLNAELLRSNEELDAFAAIVSHDLKDPLRSIHNYMQQLIAESAFVSEDQQKKGESLLRLAVRMDSLISSLLHFSRVGRIPLEFEPVNIGEVLAEAEEMVGAQKGRNCTTFNVPRPLPEAMCDRGQVREILVNLLSNAIKYSDKPACAVEVGYFGPHDLEGREHAPPSSEGQVIYYVRDNGIGIDPRYTEQIFKIFKRLHNSGNYGEGSGIGLSIVRKLVEWHGGKVWVHSTPGEGSTFYFSLSHQDR